MTPPAALLATPAASPSVASDAALSDPVPATNSDESLLARFLAGERDALGLLAERYERQLLGLASALLRGRRDLALEATQECWLRVIKYGRSFKRGSSVKTWLATFHGRRQGSGVSIVPSLTRSVRSAIAARSVQASIP